MTIKRGKDEDQTTIDRAWGPLPPNDRSPSHDNQPVEKEIQEPHAGHHVIQAGSYGTLGGKRQRRKCLTCGVRFSGNPSLQHSKLFSFLTRSRDEVIMRNINAYIDGKMSFRDIRLNPLSDIVVGVSTLYRWVRAAAVGCKTPLQVSIELQPVWGGSLQLDAFYLPVAGMPKWPLLVVDAETQDIPHATVLRDEKDSRRLTRICIELRDVLKYRPKIIVIDGHPSLLKAVQSVYPSVPVQFCAWHKERAISRILPKRKITEAQLELKKKIREFLYANTSKESDAAYQFIIDNSGRWTDRRSQRAIISIKRDRQRLTTHFRVDEKLGLTGEMRTPRTTSRTEGMISRLRGKLDQMRGLKSIENHVGIVNLLIMHHRATPLRSGEDRRSPLERAQRRVDNWLLFSQKSMGETDTPN